MKRLIIVALEFCFCSIEEAEVLACERNDFKADRFLVNTFEPKVFGPEDKFDPISFSQTSIKTIEVDVEPKAIDKLTVMREFYKVFDGCEEIEVTGLVFKEISDAFKETEEPEPHDPYSPQSFFEKVKNHLFAQETLIALDRAIGTLYCRGAWIKDYVGIFIIKNRIIVFTSQPVLYAQGGVVTNPDTGETKLRYGYAMTKPNCVVALRKV